MAQASWPSPNHNTRNVSDAEYERIAARFSDDGLWGDPSDGAVVVAGVGLQVTVQANAWASLRGHAWTSGTVPVDLAIAANASGSTRTDRVVLRLDRATWDVTAAILTGTPGAGLPGLTRDISDTGVYEIPLATVTVPNGAVSVTVTRRELYIGQRIRPCTSDNRPTIGRPGEFAYETDTGNVLVHGPGLTGYTVLHEETGILSLGPGFGTWEPVFANVGERSGRNVELRLWLRRTGSTFNTTDEDGSKLATIPSQLISTYNNYYTAQYTGSGATSRIEVRNDGEIWAGAPSSSVTPGRELRMTLNYLRK